MDMENRHRCPICENDCKKTQFQVLSLQDALRRKNHKISKWKEIAENLTKKRECLIKKIAELEAGHKRLKKNLSINSLDYDFLKKRIFKLHGPLEFLRLINTTDAPRPVDVERFKKLHKLK